MTYLLIRINQKRKTLTYNEVRQVDSTSECGHEEPHAYEHGVVHTDRSGNGGQRE